MNHKFSKKESLKRKKYFDTLFSDGSSVKKYPVRAIFVEFNKEKFPDVDLPNISQIAFSVPKKRFKLAVHRNRLKRLLREAYRLNKNILTDKYAIIFVYLSREQVDFKTMQEAVVSILNEINDVKK